MPKNLVTALPDLGTNSEPMENLKAARPTRLGSSPGTDDLTRTIYQHIEGQQGRMWPHLELARTTVLPRPFMPGTKGNPFLA